MNPYELHTREVSAKRAWDEGYEAGYRDAASAALPERETERQIWISTYGAAMGSGCAHIVAVERAYRAVLCFRAPGHWQGGPADLMKELFP